MSVWILLVVLVIAPLSLLAIRSVTMLAAFLGLSRHDAPTEGAGDSEQIRAAAVPMGGAPAIEPQPEPEPSEPPQPTHVPADSSRVCGVCGAQVLAVAHVCRHCGAALVP